ncbi:3-oxoacyl-ACP reductase FabG [Nocardia caishijiensis]|uniref:3-oxoacyl-[acyl-carrier protein] reductase n=1 Tax=Nocardia caishijiensis TaxID=184756 RepID=A0ABQ6YN62_9NOCA|nr:3-oxoacyl-ACP reductase FabG [Nocardia caishijiensis]KAF0847161.1 3-oxoacyl-[acyl-carrier protein] reductase [Nocardia caishijiensis]
MPSRTAFVTGAARGIGAATAARLAEDGCAVAVVDLDPDAAVMAAGKINASGGTAIGIGCDVADETQVAEAVARTVTDLGSLDVLVNNAGVLRDNLLFKMSLDDWDTVLAVHLRGAFLCSRAAQKHMVDNRSGAIVNTSSVSALGNRGQANYAAAKAGIQGLTRTLAMELGPFGIRVNAVAPGFIATEMTAATAERMGVRAEDLQAKTAEITPLRRVGTPADIANVVAFLASDDAGFVTGQTLYVDGGRRL